jgi:putative membrane protein
METLQSLPAFITYLFTSLLLFGAAAFAYVQLTPHAEVALIKSGNTAAAVAFSGALLGLVLPIASTIIHSDGFTDMVIWSCIAVVSQGVVFAVCTRLMGGVSEGIRAGNLAQGLALAGVAVCVGILNAACVS